jgi:hypothetical protein
MRMIEEDKICNEWRAKMEAVDMLADKRRRDIKIDKQGKDNWRRKRSGY